MADAGFDLHDGTGEPLWQESMFAVWFDEALGVGGCLRVGHEVTRGAANLWGGIVTRDGRRWRSNVDLLALGNEDRSSRRFGAGNGAFISTNSGMRMVLTEADASLELDVDDFYTPTPVWNSAEAVAAAQTIAPHHLESSGRARGKVMIDGETFEIDALVHRDHSWGIRDWSTIVSHRWLAGTFGPELSFSAVVLQAPGQRWIRGGAVVRDGVPIAATDVDIVAYVEADGVSCRGGRAVWTLATGEVLRMECSTLDGMIFRKESFLAVENVCEVRVDGHDGVGFCDLEVSNGIGQRDVTAAMRAVATDGLSRRG